MGYRDTSKDRKNETFILVAQLQILKLLITYSDLDIKEIRPDSFPNKKFQSLYQAIINLKDRNETITETALFREANLLDSSIDQTIINYVYKQEVDRSNLEGAIKSLKDALAKHKIQQITEELQQKLSSYNPLDTTEVSSLSYDIQEIVSSIYVKKDSKDFDTLYTEYIAELRERKKGLNYPFNDTFLDSQLAKRAAPGQIITLAGATGTGKSIYSLYLMNGLVNTGIPCMYFSPEMDEMSTMDRWMAMRNNLTLNMLYTVGNEMESIVTIAEKEKIELHNKPFRFMDEPNISIDMIRHYIREFKFIYDVNYAIIFVDLLTQVREFIDTTGKKGTTLPTVIEQGINKMNEIAKKENVCIVGVVQMNRDADSAKVHDIADLQLLRPTRNNIKNSNAIAERSRTVLSVFREKYYAEQLLQNLPEIEFIPDILEIQVLKQNMGQVGKIGKYNFNASTFTLNEFIEDTNNIE